MCRVFGVLPTVDRNRGLTFEALADEPGWKSELVITGQLAEVDELFNIRAVLPDQNSSRPVSDPSGPLMLV